MGTESPGPLQLSGREPCSGRHDLYFPDRTLPGWRTAISEAVALCESCSLREPCLALGDSLRAVDGVWGGVDMFYRYGPEAWRARRRQREKEIRRRDMTHLDAADMAD